MKCKVTTYVSKALKRALKGLLTHNYVVVESKEGTLLVAVPFLIVQTVVVV